MAIFEAEIGVKIEKFERESILCNYLFVMSFTEKAQMAEPEMELSGVVNTP